MSKDFTNDDMNGQSKATLQSPQANASLSSDVRTCPFIFLRGPNGDPNRDSIFIPHIGKINIGEGGLELPG